jgi:hypothetical protein
MTGVCPLRNLFPEVTVVLAFCTCVTRDVRHSYRFVAPAFHSLQASQHWGLPRNNRGVNAPNDLTNRAAGVT